MHQSYLRLVIEIGSKWCYLKPHVLLSIFFSCLTHIQYTHAHRQGNDWGPQYQAALFPHTDSQERTAEDAVTWARGELRARRRGDETSIVCDSDTDYDVASKLQVAPSVGASPVPSPVLDCFDEDNSRAGSNFIQVSSAVGDRGIAESVDGATRESPSVRTADGQKSTSEWWEGECIRTIVERRAERDFVVDIATEG